MSKSYSDQIEDLAAKILPGLLANTLPTSRDQMVVMCKAAYLMADVMYQEGQQIKTRGATEQYYSEAADMVFGNGESTPPESDLGP